MRKTSILLLPTTAIGAAIACGTGVPASPTRAAPIPGNDGAAMVPPFEADPPAVYVAKVKNILVGLPPTDDEVKAVEADPSQLKGLIDAWIALPQYQAKILTFFQLAFQQTQVSAADFADQTYPGQLDINGATQPLLVQNLKESFARTVLELNAEGRPLTQAVTTRTFMMTPALMELYAFLDVWQVDDAGKVTDRFKQANPKLTITVEAAQGPIPISDTLNPSSPNFMHWYDPDVANLATTMGATCGQDPITYPVAANTLHYLLYGGLLGRKDPNGANCNQYGGTAAAGQLTAADFSTWKMVTVRQPAAGEATTPFYDLATLRTTNELVLAVPRVGFFSTPAFFANWQTNISNQMRVTVNQALIVATGAAVDGSDATQPPATPGLDAVHASNAACVACHQTLDPTRSILAATYSWNYHDQSDTKFAAQKGLFAFQGDVVQTVNDVGDFANILAAHPLFGAAWANKLCYYANSAACDADDPEFQRVVRVFASSGYSWDVLVRELLASPLTTHAAPTKTGVDVGEVVGVSRRDHLCAALNNRLGLTDVCGLDVQSKSTLKTSVPTIVAGLPSDGYGRGAVAPVLPNLPTLFYRAGTENICEAVAALVIDVPASKQVPNVKQWSSAQPDQAVADFVALVMGITPSDARSGPAQTILMSHFTAAKQSGASASDALKSTFVAACLAPSAVSIGL
ncbi:MAG: hypothetical protein JOZ69_12595 [Myxococcales bacterium]|nr:hypothetical protein [Myxococcales bacterium]